LIELTDGRLLYVWTRKQGTSDFDRGAVVGIYSADRGETWGSAPQVIVTPWEGKADVISVSLCRSPRGVHLFFLGNGLDQMCDLQVYQMISGDEGATWSAPERISEREGYYILNNARVQRLSSGRLLAPVAYVDGDILERFRTQRVFCLYSDDDGASWQQSAEMALEYNALMEPGVIECADGSVYMTIRTCLGYLYEGRSCDGGASWNGPRQTALLSCEAPATLLRDPASDDLWIFWSNNEEAARHHMAQPRDWYNDYCDVKLRNPYSVAVSHDNARTWSAPHVIDNTPDHSFGYLSATIVDDRALLTYNDWKLTEEIFYLMNVRLRTLSLAWLRNIFA